MTRSVFGELSALEPIALDTLTRLLAMLYSLGIYASEFIYIRSKQQYMTLGIHSLIMPCVQETYHEVTISGAILTMISSLSGNMKMSTVVFV